MSNKEILDLNNQIYAQYLPTGPSHPYVQNPMINNLDGDNYSINNLSTISVNSTTPPTGSETIVTDGDLRCNNILCGSEILSNQPLLLMGTAQPLMGYPDPTVLISGGSYLQINSSALRLNDSNIEMNNGANVGEIKFDTNTGIWASNTTPDALELVATGATTKVVVSNKINTGRVYDEYFNPVYLQKGQATLNAGTVTVNIPGATPASVIIATAITQYLSQSDNPVVMSVSLTGDVVFKTTGASDNRMFNYICFA